MRAPSASSPYAPATTTTSSTGLAASRIFVAPGSAWGDERHVRIALRGPEATDRLAAALKEIAGDR